MNGFGTTDICTVILVYYHSKYDEYSNFYQTASASLLPFVSKGTKVSRALKHKI